MPARLRIGHKLTLALAVLLLTTVVVAVVGLSSVSNVNRGATALYADNIRTTRPPRRCGAACTRPRSPPSSFCSFPARPSVRSWRTSSTSRCRRSRARSWPCGRSMSATRRWRRPGSSRSWRAGWSSNGCGGPARWPPETRRPAVLEPATELAAALAATEGREARESQARAEATYRAARLRIVVLSVGSVLVCLLIALALIRDLVPRLRSYSRFAGRVADGQLGERLTPVAATRWPSSGGPST